MPGVAAAAKQMGRYVARLIKARLAGKPIRPFSYIDYGNLARWAARGVADSAGIRLRGLPAWLL